jgi:hypothetical protein
MIKIIVFINQIKYYSICYKIPLIKYTIYIYIYIYIVYLINENTV